MDIIKLASQLYLTQHPPEQFDVCGALIIGTSRVVVWDTLLHPDNMKGVPALAAGKPISVVYSHADWDHVWGTAGLPYTEVVAHESCKTRFEDPADVEATLREKRAEDPSYRAVELVAPTRTFQKTLTLGLGSVTLELHHLPGHTRDCIVAFVPELGVLLGGDTCEDPLPVVHEDSPLGTWLEALTRWRDDSRVNTVIPSHGPVSGKDLLERNIDYLTALRAGLTPEVPDEMAQFYVDTHAANLKCAVKAS